MTNFDYDSEPTEHEVATVSLALQTELSASALSHIIREGVGRAFATRPNSKRRQDELAEAINYSTLRKAIVKTTLLALKHGARLGSVVVRRYKFGTKDCLEFSVKREEFSCLPTVVSFEPVHTSFYVGFLSERAFVNRELSEAAFEGASQLTWSEDVVPPAAEDEDMKLSYVLGIDPTDYPDIQRCFKITLYRGDPKRYVRPSCEIRFKKRSFLLKDGTRNVMTWIHNFVAEGHRHDMELAAAVSSDIENLLGSEIPISAAARLLRLIGFKEVSALDLSPANESTLP